MCMNRYMRIHPARFLVGPTPKGNDGAVAVVAERERLYDWNSFKMFFSSCLIERSAEYVKIPKDKELKTMGLSDAVLQHGGYYVVIKKLKEEGELERRFDLFSRKFKITEKKAGRRRNEKAVDGLAGTGEKTMNEVVKPEPEGLMKKKSPRARTKPAIRSMEACVEAARELFRFRSTIPELQELRKMAKSKKNWATLEQQEHAAIAGQIVDFCQRHPDVWPHIVERLQAKQKESKMASAWLDAKQSVQQVFINIYGEENWVKEYQKSGRNAV